MGYKIWPTNRPGFCLRVMGSIKYALNLFRRFLRCKIAAKNVLLTFGPIGLLASWSAVMVRLVNHGIDDHALIL